MPNIRPLKNRAVPHLLAIVLLFITAGMSFAAPLGPRLRDLATTNDLWIGAAINSYWTLSDANTYTNTLKPEFNFLTPENAMKFAATEPSQNSFNYTNGDKIVSLAQWAGADVHGHNLIWYTSLPGWVTSGSWTSNTLTAVLNNHIDNVAGHWKGSIKAWDVVNESIDGSKSSTNWTQNLRGTNDIWLTKIGYTYIEKAFQRAHSVDTNAVLIYNDYSQHEVNAKSDTMYNMVADFKSRGIPIDGVGFQMHLGTAPPNFDSIGTNFNRFAKLGAKVFISEFDSKTTGDAAGLDKQARTYHNVLDKALRCPSFAGYQLWGFTDKYSWLGVTNYPLIFDTNYVAKPAYYAVQDALAVQYRSEVLTNGGFENGITAWYPYGNGSTLSIVTNGVHSGLNAIKATARTGTWAGPGQNVLAQISAQGAGRYYISGWAKFTSGSGTGKVTLRLAHDGGTEYLGVSSAISTTWTKLEGWVNVAWYKNLTNATLYVETPGSTADFYVDDVTLGDGSLADNGDFENGSTGWTGSSGGTIAATTVDAEYHYGKQGIKCTGRTLSYQGPSQDILNDLLASGPGTYNLQGYFKLASGTSTGKVTVKLIDNNGTRYLGASGAISSAQWTKVSGTTTLSWTNTLTSASVYLETPGTTVDFFADEVLLRK